MLCHRYCDGKYDPRKRTYSTAKRGSNRDRKKKYPENGDSGYCKMTCRTYI